MVHRVTDEAEASIHRAVTLHGGALSEGLSGLLQESEKLYRACMTPPALRQSACRHAVIRSAYVQSTTGLPQGHPPLHRPRSGLESTLCRGGWAELLTRHSAGGSFHMRFKSPAYIQFRWQRARKRSVLQFAVRCASWMGRRHHLPTTFRSGRELQTVSLGPLPIKGSS